MPCSCQKNNSTPVTYVVVKDGVAKAYSSEIEAKAAAARSGGTVVKK